ncbi:hypothetical protein PQR75_43870 [Paraburkholderia fungorum]|uniref:hypothetical protein n=1 Tax=Paraburkholderia fungorum TaxID=134537 RepID=UPI0038BE0C12
MALPNDPSWPMLLKKSLLCFFKSPVRKSDLSERPTKRWRTPVSRPEVVRQAFSTASGAEPTFECLRDGVGECPKMAACCHSAKCIRNLNRAPL